VKTDQPCARQGKIGVRNLWNVGRVVCDAWSIPVKTGLDMGRLTAFVSGGLRVRTQAQHAWGLAFRLVGTAALKLL
jgi:hypothetical protein